MPFALPRHRPALPRLRPARQTGLAALTLAMGMTGCVPANGPGMPWQDGARPAMRWDHRPEAAEWTQRSLLAVARHDGVLAGRVPGDIGAWCPAYAKNGLEERRAFWVALLSAVSKHESSWNPAAAGGGGRWIGLMQISPQTAAHHGCAGATSRSLKDGATNLACAVEIMAEQVGRDGVVAGSGGQGIGRDWMPLRARDKRAEMAAWTSGQSYCR